MRHMSHEGVFSGEGRALEMGIGLLGSGVFEVVPSV